MNGSVPVSPRPSDVWPCRSYPWEPRGMSDALRTALEEDPEGYVLCVSLVARGTRFRWSTRSVDVLCASVPGGLLRFEGKLLGDAEFKSGVSLGERSYDVGSFSVEADNEDLIGLVDVASDGFVVPLSGCRVEVSATHPSVDWGRRKVVAYGYLSGASYGPDGETVRFTVSPQWRDVETSLVPTIDVVAWPDAGDSVGSPYPIALGYVRKHRSIRVADSIVNPGYGVYLVNGFPIGTVVDAVYDSDGNTVTSPLGACTSERDGYGRGVETVDAASTDAELFVDARTSVSGAFEWTDPYNPGSIGDLVKWLLLRLSGISGEDLDLRGACVYSRLYLHAYAMSIDEDATCKDLLEGRVSRELYAYVSSRGGRYGITPAPFCEEVDGAPSTVLNLTWGRDLLAGGSCSETDDSSLVSSYGASWAWDPLSGDYSNASARSTTEVTSDYSFWLRVSESLNGRSADEDVELPDLRTWYDSRSVLRLDERLRGFVLRDVDYTCVPTAMEVEAGDVVRVTDERNSWSRKPFFVTGVGYTARPVVRLYLQELPLAGDFYGVHGVPGGPSGFEGQG